MLRSIVGFSALLVLLAGCSGPQEAGAPGAQSQVKPDQRRIAFIPKGATHEFWKTMQAGAEEAAKEKNVELIWKSPLKEDDRAEQIKVVENFVNERVNGIVLAPLDENALTKPAKEAMGAGIPILIVDSGLKGLDPISFIATDNYAAGKTCAENMVKALKGKRRVLVLRYQEGSASTMAREAGFIEEAKKQGLEIVSSEQYGGATRESAQTASENLIQRFAKGGSLDVDAIFTPNESTTFGMMRALESAGLLGKVTLVGFDSSKELIEGVEKGHIHGLLLQNPKRMGYLGVTSMVDHLDGKKVEAKVDSGAVFVTKENLASDEVKSLIGG
jgi:ribose transport system substrate-binding protein